eukprot:scaffold1478_cov213-Alexandrium_tamarense.AAC.11
MDAHHQQIIGDGNVVSSLVFQSSNEMAFTAQYEGGRREGSFEGDSEFRMVEIDRKQRRNWDILGAGTLVLPSYLPSTGPPT